MKRRKSKSVPVGPIRFNAEVAGYLKTAAIADQRSVASLIRIAVDRYLLWLETNPLDR